MVRLALPLMVLAFIVPQPGAAAVGLSPDQAVAVVRQAMEAAGIAGAAPVPPSRALPPCDGTVTAAPTAGNWSTVTLTCPSPRWTRALRSRAETGPPPQRAQKADPGHSRTVLGLTRALAKGAVIGPGDIGPVPLPDAAPDQVFTDPADLLGRTLRQSLGPDRPVLARHLDPVFLVQAGGPVVILTQTGVVSVSSQGRAEGNAAMGELVKVVNLGSGRSIMARVAGKDIVTVALKPFSSLP